MYRVCYQARDHLNKKAGLAQVTNQAVAKYRITNIQKGIPSNFIVTN